MDPTDQRACTYNIFIVRVQVNATLLSSYPDLWDGLILVCLVNDLWNDLGAMLDQAGIWRGQLRAVDGVGRGILD